MSSMSIPRLKFVYSFTPQRTPAIKTCIKYIGNLLKL